MTGLTAKHVRDAIKETASRLPDLTVTIGNCHGRDWIVDPETHNVYISEMLPLHRCGQSVLDALTALCDHHGLRRPGQLLHLVPAPRDGYFADGTRPCLTGTDR